jgi:Tol biopolymer transport system component
MKRRPVVTIGLLAVAAVVGVVIARSPGRSPDAITTVRGQQGCPSFSRDGRQVTFADGSSGETQVMIADVGGGDSQVITRGDDPAFSPDGRTIVYVVHGRLMQIRPSGGKPRTLVRFDGEASSPAFSADGKLVVFGHEAKADALPRAAVLDLATGEVRVLTQYPVLNPAFSPDGRHIAYDTNDDIHVMDADGRHDELAFHYPAYQPTYSPDGSQIAFAGDGIQLATLATRGSTSLTRPHDDLSLYDTCPTFSPDGRLIAFTRNQSFDAGAYETATDSQVLLVHTDGSGLRTLP